MSGTFSAMQNAIDALKEKYPEREIRYKDSKTISLGSGFITYYGALKYKDGATMDEMDEYLDELIKHTATYFAVDDLTYLYRGGRVSGTSRVIGNLLGIKPILYVNDDGKILNIQKAKGMRKAMTTMLGFMKEKGSALDKYKIYILQADCQEQAENFKQAIKAQFGEVEVEIQPVGPVIGSHCGPGTVGVIFHCKER